MAVNPDKGILQSTKKKWGLKPWKDMEEPKCLWLSEAASPKRLHTVWVQPCDILEKARLWTKYRDHWLWGVEHVEPRGLRESETALCDTVMLGICHYTFVQTHKMSNTKSDPRLNPNLWMMMTCQCRCTNCNKCTTLMSGKGKWKKSRCVCVYVHWVLLSVCHQKWVIPPIYGSFPAEKKNNLTLYWVTSSICWLQQEKV